ncbi:uroporphyrinogen-III C-methyltransferase [Martiniozyma asiatica (nom. inval.)]|nr:uroporphyrinogen-III C-methyltransferase [Martiniozyma asiatica]
MSQKLLTQLNTDDEVHLIIDNGQLSHVLSKRVAGSIQSGAKVILVNPIKNELSGILSETQLERFTQVEEPFGDSHLLSLGRSEVDGVVDRVFVIAKEADLSFKQNVFAKCRRLRIPINVYNHGELSTFTLLSTHNDGALQIGVSTNLQGCKMGSRIKREIIKALPSNINEIIENVGNIRKEIKMSSDKDRELKWLSQIVEYYPLQELAHIKQSTLDQEIKLTDSVHNVTKAQEPVSSSSVNALTDAINNINSLSSSASASASTSPASSLKSSNKKGKITLVGSGPGSPSQLTLGALNALHQADLVLSDKLVPQEIISLIPQSTQLFIARKFPGNADAAQQELLDLGLQALNEGKNVVRLKQGDPYIFGRGGEEYLFFTENGYPVNVLPGLTSAFVAPAVAGIPTTHRGVADQVLVCTGVGRKGAIPNLPEYVESRTTVFLMSINRIVDIAPILFEKGWPRNLPVSVVERASCGDQRIVRTRLGDLEEVCGVVGSRPPGLIVMGWACDVYGKLNDDEKWRVIE